MDNTVEMVTVMLTVAKRETTRKLEWEMLYATAKRAVVRFPTGYTLSIVDWGIPLHDMLSVAMLNSQDRMLWERAMSRESLAHMLGLGAEEVA